MSVAEKHTAGFSLLGNKGRIRKFASAPKSDVFLYHPHPDGTSDLRRIRDTNELSRLESGETLLRVSRKPFTTGLVFPALKSEDGEVFDLTLSLVWRMSGARDFLRDRGLKVLENQDVIGPVWFETLLTRRYKSRIADEMSTVSYDYLVHRDALPLSWWARMLPQWLGLDWMDLVEVKSVDYDSPTAEKARELAARERLAELERWEVEKNRSWTQEEERRKAELEQSLEELRQQHELTAIEQKNRAELIKLEHDAAMLAAREQAELRKLEAEKERARLEAEIASIRDHGAEIEERLQEAREAEANTREMLEAIRKAREEVKEAASMMKAAISSGIASGERLSAHAASVSPETLTLTGRTKGARFLAALVREKANVSQGAVTLKKNNLRSRDIGSGRVESLRIGSSLEFELSARRGGHVSVLNIGTSGAVYLLAPNGIVDPASARVEDNQSIIFPGAPLLPGLPLYENGPPGWEELIVVVSKEPLFDYADLAGANSEAPEVRLTIERIGRLVEQLTGWPDGDWNAGVLGFMVED